MAQSKQFNLSWTGLNLKRCGGAAVEVMLIISTATSRVLSLDLVI
jgi:hypothetical protein